jgi:hypothetical protein
MFEPRPPGEFSDWTAPLSCPNLNDPPLLDGWTKLSGNDIYLTPELSFSSWSRRCGSHRTLCSVISSKWGDPGSHLFKYHSKPCSAVANPLWESITLFPYLWLLTSDFWHFSARGMGVEALGCFSNFGTSQA